MTIATLIDKYEKKLSRVNPGQPDVGFLLEEIIDDLTECVVQGGAAELTAIKGKAWRDGYNAANENIRRKIGELFTRFAADERTGNGG